MRLAGYDYRNIERACFITIAMENHTDKLYNRYKIYLGHLNWAVLHFALRRNR